MDKDIFNGILALGLCMPRWLGALMTMPLFSAQVMPRLIRSSLVLGCAAFAAPRVAADLGTLVLFPSDWIFLCIKELILGALIGFLVSLPLWALEAAGELCDLQRGATMAQALSPFSGQQGSPLGQLLNLTAVALFFRVGGTTALFAAMNDTFLAFPVLHGWPGIRESAAPQLLSAMGRLGTLMLLWAAPALVAMFLAETGLAVVSRFVQQLQVFFLAMPIKSSLAMFVLAMGLGAMLDQAVQMLAVGMKSLVTELFLIVGPR